MCQNDLTFNAALQALGQNAAAVGHLSNVLAAMQTTERAKGQELSRAALFDESQRAYALMQCGRLELVDELQRRLEPFVKQHKQQYTR